MERLFEIASKVSTPLALGGIVVVVLFLIYRAILRLKIFTKVTKTDTFKLINSLIIYLFILAVVAVVLAAISYVLVHYIQNVSPTTIESSSEDFSVIHSVWEEMEPFPIIAVTLKNNTKKAQVITQVHVVIDQFGGAGGGPPETRVLEPLETWDIPLQAREGTFPYKPRYPVYILSDDAATIRLRLYADVNGGSVHPNEVGYYLLRFTFVCDSGLEDDTEILDL